MRNDSFRGQAMFDVIIRNGEVIDGTGSTRFRADVGIKDDRIVQIGHARSVHVQGPVHVQGHSTIASNNVLPRCVDNPTPAWQRSE